MYLTFQNGMCILCIGSKLLISTRRLFKTSPAPYHVNSIEKSARLMSWH
jgi:hypothetical protein